MISKKARAAAGLAATFFFLAMAPAAHANRTSNLRIRVTDADTGKPIFQAQLTLQFPTRVGKSFFKHTKWIEYTGKTNAKGICEFQFVTEGVIELMVTAPNHQSFGKKLSFTKPNQLIEIKLRKPHSLL